MIGIILLFHILLQNSDLFNDRTVVKASESSFLKSNVLISHGDTELISPVLSHHVISFNGKIFRRDEIVKNFLCLVLSN